MLRRTLLTLAPLLLPASASFEAAGVRSAKPMRVEPEGDGVRRGAVRK